MKIHIVQCFTLQDGSHVSGWIKTFESTIRPMENDLLDDPGFYAEPYEYTIIKVAINYVMDECYVSMKPIFIENLNVLHTYMRKLKMNGWSAIPTEEFVHGDTNVVQKEYDKNM